MKKKPDTKLLPTQVGSLALDASSYFNRELSWLHFNQRVIEQALSEQYPLLERVRYLSFSSANLDEFFEIRVAGLMQQSDAAVDDAGPDGLSSTQQLQRIAQVTRSMVQAQYQCWEQQLLPLLRKAPVQLLCISALSGPDLAPFEAYFDAHVYPVLTPLTLDPAHPFPQLISKSLNVIVALRSPLEPQELRVGVVPVPRMLPGFIRTAKGGVFLSELVRHFAHKLFRGYESLGAWDFRITRNSDLYVDEEEAHNLLQKIEEELRKIRRGMAVRLEIRQGAPDALLARLLEATQLSADWVYTVPSLVDLQQLEALYNACEVPQLKFPSFQPRLPECLHQGKPLFEVIRRQDLLLHHPFEGFAPVIEFIEAAAHDPSVLAIKQTLYRTSGDSPIVEALKQASLKGKQVTALVELKARFDEANNIQWAKQLEAAGAHVVYGMMGLKTHCKCCLVVRQEEGSLRQYVHLGTGNYNPKTAKTYTDLSYFSANPQLAHEVGQLFNALTGLALEPHFEQLWVAPFNLHERIQQAIVRETYNAKQGLEARIFAKLNSLVDPATIASLYEASQAGVQVELVVRGICCLVPGVKGLSERITVRSLLGRYLEHSRLFYFHNAPSEPLILIGSADWMPRNFFRRVEVLLPVRDGVLRDQLIHGIIPAYLKDTHAWHLGSKGQYSLPKASKPFSAQDHFMGRST
jgi:polyphosphate kinase